ncbi:MAG: hypothetical protein QXI39_07815 [Candidatus Bathyarchaeia archaeon]
MKALNELNRLIDECFAGKLSGAIIERLIEAIKLSLKVSRSLNKIDDGIESPPASIELLKRLKETKILQEAYLEGFKDGIRWILKNKDELK